MASRPAARDLALWVLSENARRGIWVEDALATVLRRHPRLPPAERALLLELVQGVKRWEIWLDWALSHFLPQPLKKLHPRVLLILRLGAYQLRFLSRIPARAAIHEAVAQAKAAGLPQAHGGLINAVLRRLAREGPPPLPPKERDPVAHLSLAYAHPPWLVQRWLRREGLPAAEARLAANNRVPPLTVRVNTLKTTPEALIPRLAAEGISARPTTFYPHGLVLMAWRTPPPEAPSYGEGLWRFQDEGAMLAGLLLPLSPGDTVLELGAGRGGKTTHLAERLHNQGLVAAVELHSGRLRELRQALRAWGATVAAPLRADAGRALPLKEGACDAALLDVPCSGLGTLRRHPEIKTRLAEADLATFPPRQLRMLEVAAPAVRPGGRLLYLTCTTEPEENEEVVAAFLKEHRDFRLHPHPELLPPPVRPFLEAPGWFRTSPAPHGVDAFFGALLVRTG
ncbi:MAG: 16S rRNA (cytosine(967)-C(5))-methyltransferase RsmB [Syntrophobacterales bacterium]|nr:16S rRNA (cytosine(967)-C(5))-methyltransferase RsmB [Syntrophobacterales bacterium]